MTEWSDLMKSATQGDEVYLREGTYILDGAVHKIPAGVTVRGAGRGRTRLLCSGDVPNPNTFIQMGSGSTLRDLTVDIDGQNANGVCIFEAKHCLVDNVEVINCPGYAFWVIDYAGQAGDLGVQYGHSTIRNCYAEGKEGFECFYVEEVNFEGCFAKGVTDLGDGATASLNGFLNRDSCRGIRYTDCEAEGTFAGNALKWTNNDDATLYETDGAIVNCKFKNDYDGTDRFCMYFLDMANVRVKNTTCRATNDCSGVFWSVTSTSNQDCRSDIEVDVSCAGAGIPLDHAKGDNVKYSGRFKSTSSQYIVDIGTNSSKSDNVKFVDADFHFDSDHASARLFKFNDSQDLLFDRCRLLGDGTNYQFADLGSSSVPLRVKFKNCIFDGVRINKLHHNGWAVHDCLFKNKADAGIGSGQYINCNGASVDYYSILGNRYILEGSSPPTALVTADTASNKQVADNLEVT